jgi:hypothetical protein
VGTTDVGVVATVVVVGEAAGAAATTVRTPRESRERRVCATCLSDFGCSDVRADGAASATPSASTPLTEATKPIVAISQRRRTVRLLWISTMC